MSSDILVISEDDVPRTEASELISPTIFCRLSRRWLRFFLSFPSSSEPKYPTSCVRFPSLNLSDASARMRILEVIDFESLIKKKAFKTSTSSRNTIVTVGFTSELKFSDDCF